MDKLSGLANKFTGENKGQHSGGGGGGNAGSGGQQDYLDKGLDDVEQKYGGEYYDKEKMKPVNKKVTDKVKDVFHEKTGHDLPGTHK